MPTYTLDELLVIGEKGQPVVPEFKWNDIQKAAPGEEAGAQGGLGNRRRSSHHHHNRRPVVMPKAAIPLALDEHHAFSNHTNDRAVAEDEDEGSDIDDELAARFFLKKQRSQQLAQNPDAARNGEDGAPVVPLKYAAAIAASMHMEGAGSSSGGTSAPPSGEGEGEAVEGAEDDGWQTVSHVPKKKPYRKSSFSRWRH